MVDVVVNEDLLRRNYGLLDRMQLLRYVEAGPLLLEHRDDGPQVAFRAPQAIEDVGVSLVKHGFRHVQSISPPGGYAKRALLDLQVPELMIAISLLAIGIF